MFYMAKACGLRCIGRFNIFSQKSGFLGEGGNNTNPYQFIPLFLGIYKIIVLAQIISL